MTENDVLGFNPQDLSVFAENDAPKSAGNPLVYHTRPVDSISDDKIYRSTIKVIYNPFNLRRSILEQQSYAMEDSNGFFSVVSSLTEQDTNCPIFKAWKKCRYSDENSVLYNQQLGKDKGGKGLFDKRFSRYCVIQVMADKNQPDLVGKYMFWKLPKAVWDIINTKMNPSAESGKAPIPVMDFLFGRSIDIEVTPGPGKPGDERYSRETKYMAELSEDVVTCTYPDGSPLLNADEQTILDSYVDAMTKVWKQKDPTVRESLKAEVDKDPNTVELKKIYTKVLEEIKTFCPNLIESLGYKEWTPEMTARVNAWINVVLEGNNPKEGANPATSAPSVSTATESAPTPPVTVATPTAAPVSSGSTDDLPF